MVDRIIFLEHGQTTAEGTYHGLMSSNRSFAALIEEFGNKHETTKVTENDSRKQKTVRPMPTIASDAESLVKEHKVLMSQEERETGSVDWKSMHIWTPHTLLADKIHCISVYKGYFAHGRGTVFLPLLVVVIVLTQGWVFTDLCIDFAHLHG